MAISQQDQQAFARSLGYSGEFGAGGFGNWLSTRPNEKNRFDSFINGGAIGTPTAQAPSAPKPAAPSVVSQPAATTAPQQYAPNALANNTQGQMDYAKQLGYTGGFQGNDFTYWLQKNPDAAGKFNQASSGVPYQSSVNTLSKTQANQPGFTPAPTSPKPLNTAPGSAGLAQPAASTVPGSASQPAAQPASQPAAQTVAAPAPPAAPAPSYPAPAALPADFSDALYAQLNPSIQQFLTGGQHTKQQNEALARAMGYTGEFGQGGFGKYLESNPALADLFYRFDKGGALTPAEYYQNIGQKQGQQYAPNLETYFNDLFAPFLQELQAATPATPASQPITFTRPTAMNVPTGYSDFAGMDPMQRRSAIATMGTQGGGTDRELQDYYFNLLQQGLISPEGAIGQFDLLPIERNYLQMLGMPFGDEEDFLTALYKEQQARNAPLASSGSNDLLAYLFS